MIELTLIRHAESIYNKKKIYQGKKDIVLSEEGLKETIEKSKTFDSNNYDICFCSPLKRTKKTAAILAPNLKIIYDNRLIERSLGDFEGTYFSEEKFKILHQNITPPNGESREEVLVRVNDFVEFLKNNYDNKRILVVTHAGTIKSFLRLFNLENRSINNLETLKIVIK